MYHRFISYIVNKFVEDKIICSEDKELYEYGMTIGIEYILNVLSVLVIALCTGEILACFTLYLSFMFLRTYSGGLHAESFLGCYILSNISIITLIVLIKYNIIGLIIYEIMAGFLTVFLLYIGPVQSSSKELSEKEKDFFRKKEYLIICILVFVSLITRICNMYNIEKSILSTLILTGFTSLIVILKDKLITIIKKV